MKREQISRVAAKANRTRAGRGSGLIVVPTTKPQPELAKPAPPDPEAGKEMADVVASGVALNAAVTHDWVTKQKDSALTLGCAIDAVTTACRRTRDTDLGDVEELLRAQTITLNTVFANLLSKASESVLLDHLERYLRLALKAQSQCRTTCETLAVLKNPPIFARNANVAHNQQVNVNAALAPETLGGSRAGKNESRQNELLEDPRGSRQLERGERLDLETTGLTVAGHPALASVGALDGPADRGT